MKENKVAGIWRRKVEKDIRSVWLVSRVESESDGRWDDPATVPKRDGRDLGLALKTEPRRDFFTMHHCAAVRMLSNHIVKF